MTVSNIPMTLAASSIQAKALAALLAGDKLITATQASQQAERAKLDAAMRGVENKALTAFLAAMDKAEPVNVDLWRSDWSKPVVEAFQKQNEKTALSRTSQFRNLVMAATHGMEALKEESRRDYTQRATTWLVEQGITVSHGNSGAKLSKETREAFKAAGEKPGAASDYLKSVSGNDAPTQDDVKLAEAFFLLAAGSVKYARVMSVAFLDHPEQMEQAIGEVANPRPAPRAGRQPRA